MNTFFLIAGVIAMMFAAIKSKQIEDREAGMENLKEAFLAAILVAVSVMLIVSVISRM